MIINLGMLICDNSLLSLSIDQHIDSGLAEDNFYSYNCHKIHGYLAGTVYLQQINSQSIEESPEP
jgi:hypothetical protein